MPMHCPAYPLIDLLKIVAAQCVVWHHLAAYGPLSDAAAQSAPALFDWLYDYARMAVQIFLVVAGYLAARSLGQGLQNHRRLLQFWWQRYARLVMPFLLALLITMLCSALVRPYLDADLVPDAPSLGQWLAHVSLLHSLLGVDALSAGVWYVAIDFQLYALLAWVLWWSRRSQWKAVALTAALSVASLTWFNLDADYDCWALYFFGAYGLGALAWWANSWAQRDWTVRLGYLGTVLLGVLSLMLDFRERIALALLVSSVLVVFGSSPLRLPPWLNRWVRQLSHSAYALFLLHFAMLLLANAMWAGLGGQSGDWALVCLGVTWLLSVWASVVFHAQVEQRLNQWLARSPAVSAVGHR